jgi:hypothetical protein
VSDSLHLNDSVKVETVTFFSLHLAEGAIDSVRRCKAAETEDTSMNVRAEMFRRSLAAATSAVFFSVAFLEATINELYFDMTREVHEYQLRASAVSALAEVWRGEISRDRLGILTKYQLALSLCGQELLSRGVAPFQDVELVIALRNSLVHYRPSGQVVYADSEPLTETLYERKLKPKIAPNPLAPNQAFPYSCLGASGAVWAWTSSLAFTDTFFGRIGVPAVYDALRPVLTDLRGRGA